MSCLCADLGTGLGPDLQAGLVRGGLCFDRLGLGVGVFDDQIEQFGQTHPHGGCLLRNDALRAHPGDGVDFDQVRGFALDDKVDPHDAPTIQGFIGGQGQSVDLCDHRGGQIGRRDFPGTTFIFCIVIEKFGFADQFGDREDILFAAGDHHAATDLPSFDELFQQGLIALFPTLCVRLLRVLRSV